MREIPLNGGYVALVDDEDYGRVASRKWHAFVNRRSDGRAKVVYAKTNAYIDGKVTGLLLHREILGLSSTDKRICDHINHDGLDCRKENLRICTPAQNMANSRICRKNTSGVKGVYLDKRWNLWHARLKVNRRNVSLGLYKTKEEAALAYAEKLRSVHGEFAYSGSKVSLAELRSALEEK